MDPAENLTRKGKGRPKGSPNKLGKAAKDVIAQVADAMGGADRMLAWVKEDPKNESAYWERIYPKLLPLTVAGDKDNPLLTGLTVKFVKPD
jgi:hypothetical protein